MPIIQGMRAPLGAAVAPISATHGFEGLVDNEMTPMSVNTHTHTNSIYMDP